jgi:hypothetical protein
LGLKQNYLRARACFTEETSLDASSLGDGHTHGSFQGCQPVLSQSLAGDANSYPEGYFGGALEYNKNWVGRYFLQGATILGSSILPSIAYRINRWLSIGAGANVMIGYLKERVAIANAFEKLPDGQMTLMDWTADGTRERRIFGASLGLVRAQSVRRTCRPAHRRDHDCEIEELVNARLRASALSLRITEWKV